MNITTDPNLWAISGLVFLLGLLVGVFLTAGGRRKWKTRYNSEVDRRREIEKSHVERTREWEAREKELNSRPVAAPVVAAAPVAAAPLVDQTVVGDRVATSDRDLNNDGHVGPVEAAETSRPAGFVDRMLGRDKDDNGTRDRDQAARIDRNRDGVDDRNQ